MENAVALGSGEASTRDCHNIHNDKVGSIAVYLQHQRSGGHRQRALVLSTHSTYPIGPLQLRARAWGEIHIR